MSVEEDSGYMVVAEERANERAPLSVRPLRESLSIVRAKFEERERTTSSLW